MISIVERCDLDEESYNSLLIEAAPQLIYTNLNFLDGIAEYTRSTVIFVVKVENHKMIAALPFCMYSGTYGPVINSLPFFGSNGGIISKSKNSHDLQELINGLINYAKVKNCIAITIIESPLGNQNREIYKSFELHDVRIGLYNEINPDLSMDSIIQTFKGRARHAIKRAIDSNLRVITSQATESIEFLAKIHNENMTLAGRRSKDRDFFIYFLDKIGIDHWIILEAFLEEKRVASLLLVYNSDCVEYFTPVTLDQHKNLHPMSLLLLHGFMFATKRQIRFWNWGGTWIDQEGVYRFKTQWNPIETRYFYYTKVLKPSIFDLDPKLLMEAYPFFYVYPMK